MQATAEKFLLTEFDAAAFDPLLRDPGDKVRGTLNGFSYTARIAIPHYTKCIARHYRDVAPNGLAVTCVAAEIPFDLPQFGLVVSFAEAAEIAIHDDAMLLNESIRILVDRFGPVIFRNAHIESSKRKRFHRNVFPHLRFHIDRGPAQPNQFSCFTRDPFDAEQRRPRLSSTLFLAKIVAWLELVRAAGCSFRPNRGALANCELFEGTDMATLLGEVVLEQPWSEPDGTGEIAVIDNRTVLHATYHKDGRTKGYPIGTRYLV